MIGALDVALGECESVKDEYLEGDMPDKEAKRKLDEIQNRYQPIADQLEKADSKGELNYDQHKELANIMSKAVNQTFDGAKKVLDDVGLNADDIKDMGDSY